MFYITEKLKHILSFICITKNKTMNITGFPDTALNQLFPRMKRRFLLAAWRTWKYPPLPPLTLRHISANHLSLRKIVGFLDTETAEKVCKLWKRVKEQQIPSVRFLRGASGFGIEHVTLSYPGLERIEINERLWNQFDDDDTDVIANNCRYLKKINIANCGRITSVANLVRKCPELTYIKVRGCYQLTDDSMKDIANNCPELTDIDTAFCNEISDIGVISIAEKCPNLTAVNFDGCSKITDTAIHVITEKCPKLKTIEFKGCGNISMNTIANISNKCQDVSDLSYVL